LERLTSRATLGVAHARDLVGLRACLQPLPEIRTHLGEATAPLLTTARDEIAPLDALLALLQQALVDEPPLVLHEGGLIREGWRSTGPRCSAPRSAAGGSSTSCSRTSGVALPPKPGRC